MRLKFADRVPPIPGKRMFGNTDATFIRTRQAGLQASPETAGERTVARQIVLFTVYRNVRDRDLVTKSA